MNEYTRLVGCGFAISGMMMCGMWLYLARRSAATERIQVITDRDLQLYEYFVTEDNTIVIKLKSNGSAPKQDEWGIINSTMSFNEEPQMHTVVMGMNVTHIPGQPDLIPHAQGQELHELCR